MELTGKLHHGNFTLAQGTYSGHLFGWTQIPPHCCDDVNPKGPLLPTALLKANPFLSWGKTGLVWIQMVNSQPEQWDKVLQTKSFHLEKNRFFFVCLFVCSPIIISNPSSIILFQDEPSPLPNDTEQGDNLFWRHFKICTFPFSKPY